MIVILEEKLEPATKAQFELLKDQMALDPETNYMLNTPMKDIPQYFWLYEREDIYRNIKFAPLYNALVFLAGVPQITVEFSKAGNKFTGFISYNVEGTEIISIKMASFKNDEKNSNPILAVDLLNFLEREIKKRTKIEWLAHKANTKAVKQYDRVLKDKFIYFKEPSKDNKMWLYTVTKKI